MVSMESRTKSGLVGVNSLSLENLLKNLLPIYYHIETKNQKKAQKKCKTGRAPILHFLLCFCVLMLLFMVGGEGFEPSASTV